MKRCRHKMLLLVLVEVAPDSDNKEKRHGLQSPGEVGRQASKQVIKARAVVGPPYLRSLDHTRPQSATG